jgi:hypothetical protein
MHELATYRRKVVMLESHARELEGELGVSYEDLKAVRAHCEALEERNKSLERALVAGIGEAGARAVLAALGDV